MNTVNISRRRFLKTTAVLGGGLVVGFSLTGCSKAPLPIDTADGGFVPNAFLQLLPDNTIRFYCPRDEMGQGVTTGLTTVIAEELDVDPASIQVEFAGVHSAYENPDMGLQATGGSNSMKAHFMPLRQAGANTRALIIDAAAKDLGVARSRISTDNAHVIVDGVIVDDERHPYGQFVATAAGMKVPEKAPLKSANDFKYIGKERARLDAIAKATGTAEYGIDVDIPGMHHAVVVRSPVAGARLERVDTLAAKKMPGVSDVIEISNGIAVVAEKYWQAKNAAAALKPQWEAVPLARVDTNTVKADYEAALASGEGDNTVVDPEKGDVEAGLSSAQQVVEGEYWAPYLAHAPLEPMSAVLKISNGEADLWAGTQGPVGAQGLVSRFSDIPAEKVRVHSTYLGGGFGRRGTLTHIVEITEIAKAANKPIHLLWSREDDIRNGVYRPASLMKIRAGIDDAGRITTWDAARAGGNITPTTLKNALPGLFPGLAQTPINWVVGLSDDIFKGWTTDHSSIEGLYEDYDFDNLKVTHTTVDHGVPLTFWRSVGHSYTAFATESMIDELAIATDTDPVALRLANTQNNQRLNNVIRIAGEKMKQMTPAEGRFLGFAAHHSFATDVAQIAEVSLANNHIRVHKVTCVVDCGTAVNPDMVRAQMEGGIMFGLTAALHGELNLENGAIKESNFHDYPMLRMNEAPEVDVVIVESGTAPTGVGEPGLPPVAPAVANAVYRATGQRLRALPLRVEA